MDRNDKRALAEGFKAYIQECRKANNATAATIAQDVAGKIAVRLAAGCSHFDPVRFLQACGIAQESAAP